MRVGKSAFIFFEFSNSITGILTFEQQLLLKKQQLQNIDHFYECFLSLWTEAANQKEEQIFSVPYGCHCRSCVAKHKLVLTSSKFMASVDVLKEGYCALKIVYIQLTENAPSHSLVPDEVMDTQPRQGTSNPFRSSERMLVVTFHIFYTLTICRFSLQARRKVT